MDFRNKSVIFLLFQTWMLCKAFSSPLWTSLKKRQYYAQHVHHLTSNGAFGAARTKVTTATTSITRRREIICRNFCGIIATNCRTYGFIGTRGGGSLFSHSSANSIESATSTAVPPIFTTDAEAHKINRIKSILVADDEEFIKPLPDKGRYHSIRLASNNLHVLLVSDPNTDTEAAAVDLRTGHFNDPINRQGLAHYLEHNLFLGLLNIPLNRNMKGI